MGENGQTANLTGKKNGYTTQQFLKSQERNKTVTIGKALDGKPYAGNPHVRFDEGEVAPAATPRRGSLLYFCATALAVASAFAADVEWPSDFDEKLAAHIADEKSTNPTFEVYSMQVDACYRTIGTCELAVARMPGSGFYIIVK